MTWKEKGKDLSPVPFNPQCLSYFPNIAKDARTQVERECLFGALSFRGLMSLPSWWEHGSEQAGMVLEQELTACI